MTCRTVTYHFEEMPLIITGDDFEDHGLYGEALITYWPDGTYEVSSIWLDGSKFIDGRHAHKAIPLDRGSPLYDIAHHRLTVTWRRHVRNFIQEDMAKWSGDHINQKADHDYKLRKEMA